MNVLLDTHTFWWLIHDDPQLSAKAREIIANPSNSILCSDITAWEIAIKASLERMSVPEAVDSWFMRHIKASGLTHAPIGLQAIARVRDLPWHHKDPFDRLLTATALRDNLTLLSRDEVFDRYGVNRIW